AAAQASRGRGDGYKSQGRTGRAGRGGLAIAFCDYNEQPLLKDIEKLMGKKVPQVKDHPWPMQDFNPPAKDKGGKVRNPEDEEARAAARELAKARREANAAKAATPVSQESAPAPEQAKGKKKGKKTQKPAQTEPVVPIPDLLPKREEQPAEPARTFDSSDILHRKYKRPEKKVIPSLSSVSLLPNVELKETFGSRTIVTDGKLSTPARDATDRLFSDWKEIPEKYRPERREEPESAGKNSRKSGKKSSGKQSTRQRPEATAQKQEGKKQPAAQKQTGWKSAAPKQSVGKSTSQKQSGGKQARQQQPKAAAAQKQTGGNSSRQHPANQGKKTRIPPRTERPERQKDSTEQKSLMKPYYLSDRRKG
ncbi:MAG: hypothetical protein LUC35_01400, partial [Clostridiales bacterium]|nr:hypothetical protein [Clostridiales bacterium]